MFTPSATKEYVVNQLPDDPSQITLITFSDGIYGFQAYKVGKLYFGIRTTTTGGGFGGVLAVTKNGPGGANATANQIAVALGSTLNTSYDANWTPTGAVNNCAGYGGGSWSLVIAGSAGNEILGGVLIN